MNKLLGTYLLKPNRLRTRASRRSLVVQPQAQDVQSETVETPNTLSPSEALLEVKKADLKNFVLAPACWSTHFANYHKTKRNLSPSKLIQCPNNLKPSSRRAVVVSTKIRNINKLLGFPKKGQIRHYCFMIKEIDPNDAYEPKKNEPDPEEKSIFTSINRRADMLYKESEEKAERLSVASASTVASQRNPLLPKNEETIYEKINKSAEMLYQKSLAHITEEEERFWKAMKQKSIKFKNTPRVPRKIKGYSNGTIEGMSLTQIITERYRRKSGTPLRRHNEVNSMGTRGFSEGRGINVPEETEDQGVSLSSNSAVSFNPSKMMHLMVGYQGQSRMASSQVPPNPSNQPEAKIDKKLELNKDKLINIIKSSKEYYNPNEKHEFSSGLPAVKMAEPEKKILKEIPPKKDLDITTFIDDKVKADELQLKVTASMKLADLAKSDNFTQVCSKVREQLEELGEEGKQLKYSIEVKSNSVVHFEEGQEVIPQKAEAEEQDGGFKPSVPIPIFGKVEDVVMSNETDLLRASVARKYLSETKEEASQDILKKLQVPEPKKTFEIPSPKKVFYSKKKEPVPKPIEEGEEVIMEKLKKGKSFYQDLHQELYEDEYDNSGKVPPLAVPSKNTAEELSEELNKIKADSLQTETYLEILRNEVEDQSAKDENPLLDGAKVEPEILAKDNEAENTLNPEEIKVSVSDLEDFSPKKDSKVEKGKSNKPDKIIAKSKEEFLPEAGLEMAEVLKEKLGKKEADLERELRYSKEFYQHLPLTIISQNVDLTKILNKEKADSGEDVKSEKEDIKSKIDLAWMIDEEVDVKKKLEEGRYAASSEEEPPRVRPMTGMILDSNEIKKMFPRRVVKVSVKAADKGTPRIERKVERPKMEKKRIAWVEEPPIPQKNLDEDSSKWKELESSNVLVDNDYEDYDDSDDGMKLDSNQEVKRDKTMELKLSKSVPVVFKLVMPEKISDPASTKISVEDEAGLRETYKKQASKSGQTFEDFKKELIQDIMDKMQNVMMVEQNEDQGVMKAKDAVKALRKNIELKSKYSTNKNDDEVD